MKSQTSARLDDREAAICQRFREIRSRLKWKMPDFAKELGLTRDRLASYEYARAPVRYILGRSVCERFDINQRWLATGALPRGHYVDIHDYFESQIPHKMLFSEAFDKFLLQLIEGRLQKIALSLHCKIEDIDSSKQIVGVSWPLGYPELSKLYHTRLVNLRLHQQPAEVQKRVYRELNSALERSLDEFYSRAKASRDELSQRGGQSKDKVDTVAGAAMLSGVTSGVPTWLKLKKEVLELTAEHGMKAWLADELEVSRQVLNNWLSTSDQGRPDAVNTLLLLRWVKGGGGKTKIPRK